MVKEEALKDARNNTSLLAEFSGETKRIQADTDGNLITKTGAVSDNTPIVFEDTSFVVGDSPAVLDCNTGLGRNATEFSIQNDGAGDFTVSVSIDGAAFGEEKTVKAGEVYEKDQLSVDSIRITHVLDSAYRVTAV